MITDIEQETLDIDWFFTNGADIGFIASAGGKLPHSVADKSFDEVAFLATYFKDLLKTSKAIVIYNSKTVTTSSANDEMSISYFTEMAEKGLFAFDKTNLGRFSDTHYHLVAKPTNPLKFDDLPSEIARLLTKTHANRDMEESLDIGSID